MKAEHRSAAIRARLDVRLGHVLTHIEEVLNEKPHIRTTAVGEFSTAVDALSHVRAEREYLTTEAAALLAGLIAALVSRPLQDAVSARAMEWWGWPDTSTAGRALALLAHVAELGESYPEWRWPMDVAPLGVARWAPFVRHAPTDAADLERYARDANFAALGCVRFVGPAWLYRAAQSVDHDRARRAIAIDAGRPHRHLLAGWRDLPKDRTPQTFHPNEHNRLELLGPGLSVQLQLELDADGTASDAVIRVVRDTKGWRALRHWAALLRLLSVEGHRRGWVRWTLDAHLDAMNVPAANRHKADVRAEAIRQVEGFTKLELAVYAEDGTERERRPLVLVGSKYDKLNGSQWELNGLEIVLNPLLYRGVRHENGRLGKNWHPAPVELAHVNEVRHPHAIALGLILPTRWRLAANEGRDHITLSGRNALKLAGVKYSRHNPARAWASLDRDLCELQRIGGLGRFVWTSGQQTLDGMIALWPAEWASDRTQHGVRPIEPPPAESVLTGSDLKAWRDGRGLSQAEAAGLLGVSARTLIRAEGKPEKPLTAGLARKIRTPAVTGKVRATLDGLTLSAAGKVGK